MNAPGPSATHRFALPATLLLLFIALSLIIRFFGAETTVQASPADDSPATPAFCQGVYHGDTSTGVNQIETYGCRPDWPETGPEHYYELNITQTQPITLTLNHAPDPGLDLDLFLLEDADPDRCYADDANLILPALTPGRYTIVIDGYTGSKGPYVLNVDCSEPPLATATPTATPRGTATPTPTVSPTVTPTPTATPTRTHLTYYHYLPSLQQRHPPPTPEPTTLVLQPGVAGYDGVVDTYINAWDPQANYAKVDRLRLRQTDIMAPLIRFDLSTLPSEAHIVEAQLSLWSFNRSNDNPATVGVYLLNRTWHEEQATWLHATATQAWSIPGANAAPDDRNATSYVTTEVSETKRWYDWDVTAMVQNWVRNPEDDNGVILKAFAIPKVQYDFASSEYNTPAARPKLTIRYWTPPPTSVLDF
ncbi:MAG TPA: DNRLRE domain-containing protein [Caldilineae bacterium]|nr:DNRLRE domain-containing protein [Caldilineae bacterium]